ncbi:hypothetical protein ACLKA6_000198 [Drosophila palustris]
MALWLLQVDGSEVKLGMATPTATTTWERYSTTTTSSRHRHRCHCAGAKRHYGSIRGVKREGQKAGLEGLSIHCSYRISCRVISVLVSRK